MNIIEYKVNINKLDNLINRGRMKKLKDMHLCMNKDTLNCMEASLTESNVQYRPNKNASCLPYYCGLPIVTAEKLEFGEVHLFGLEDKPCTRITIYTDGSKKVETNATDKVFIMMAEEGL